MRPIDQQENEAKTQEHNMEAGEDNVDEEYYEEEEEVGEEEEFVPGQEIELSHEDVWDDTELIDAWHAAVKEYEAYHYEPKRTGNPKSSTRSSNGAATTSDSKPATATLPTNIHSKISKHQQQTNKVNNSSSSTHTSSDRKPSFKRADKPEFQHLKSSYAEGSSSPLSAPANSSPSSKKSTNGRSQTANGEGITKSSSKGKRSVDKADSSLDPEAETETTATGTTTTDVPAGLDQATIQYYAQMGYYYDPNYASTTTTSSEPATKKQKSTAPPPTPPHHHHPHHPFYAHQQAHLAHSPYGYMGYPPPHIPSSTPMSIPPGLMPPPPPPIPATMTGGGSRMDDEALSNLIMAWYYSGYYTGLYQAGRR